MNPDLLSLRALQRRFDDDDEFFASSSAYRDGSFAFLHFEAETASMTSASIESMHEEERNLDIPCTATGCTLLFPNVAAFERHLFNNHRHRCSLCHKDLPTSRLLDIHISERHDSFFAVLAARQPSYVCLVEGCPIVSASDATRRTHLIEDHRFPKLYDFHNPGRYLRKHKNKHLTMKEKEKGKKVDEMCISAESETRMLPSPFSFASAVHTTRGRSSTFIHRTSTKIPMEGSEATQGPGQGQGQVTPGLVESCSCSPSGMCTDPDLDLDLPTNAHPHTFLSGTLEGKEASIDAPVALSLPPSSSLIAPCVSKAKHNKGGQKTTRCWFFTRSGGCRFGARCTFIHDDVVNGVRKADPGQQQTSSNLDQLDTGSHFSSRTTTTTMRPTMRPKPEKATEVEMEMMEDCDDEWECESENHLNLTVGAGGGHCRDHGGMEVDSDARIEASKLNLQYSRFVPSHISFGGRGRGRGRGLR